MDMHNTTRFAVILTWILLDRQSKADLISIAKILVNIKKMRGEDAIGVYCNSR